jgi:hypothetical protein
VAVVASLAVAALFWSLVAFVSSFDVVVVVVVVVVATVVWSSLLPIEDFFSPSHSNTFHSIIYYFEILITD